MLPLAHKYDVQPLLGDISTWAKAPTYSADPGSHKYAPRWLKLATQLQVGGLVGGKWGW